ncbi:hypothetical protein [Spongiimicrobium salis]|uniref:hypothetical protein n=1 Tax=Spongiimicrobium salis TaxID=1667022 RepID=UPI00374DAB9E
MEKNDDFYVGYLDHVAPNTKKLLKRFVAVTFMILLGIAAVFALTQNKDKNSAFDFDTSTKITGVYHEMPYPMLRVQTSENSYKNILLLGFGKWGANPYLAKIRKQETPLSGSVLSIEGNLIYYNGKTLLQITDEEKITVLEKPKTSNLPTLNALVAQMELEGEIIDPKCYFGVMKPGKGKIHRSCAVLCISGGIPPVLATTDKNNISEYYLITDTEGNAINEAILPYIGKPALLTGTIVQLEDWHQLRLNVDQIEDLKLPSNIY